MMTMQKKNQHKILVSSAELHIRRLLARKNHLKKERK